jgi:hypothetical protein
MLQPVLLFIIINVSAQAQAAFCLNDAYRIGVGDLSSGLALAQYMCVGKQLIMQQHTAHRFLFVSHTDRLHMQYRTVHYIAMFGTAMLISHGAICVIAPCMTSMAVQCTAVGSTVLACMCKR